MTISVVGIMQIQEIYILRVNMMRKKVERSLSLSSICPHLHLKGLFLIYSFLLPEKDISKKGQRIFLSNPISQNS